MKVTLNFKGNEMAMVFCRGCGKEIHESAASCPHCGAQKTNPVSTSNSSDTGFINLGLQPFNKYATFQGRARRKEYWYFGLICFAVNVVIGILGGISGSLESVNVISGLFSLATIIPSIAVGVRRMHDTDRSGWWLLLPIVNLVFLCSDGQRNSNRYGNDPKSA
jgi:uncharacterized membrane protein YhaH (DUF805 family)